MEPGPDSTDAPAVNNEPAIRPAQSKTLTVSQAGLEFLKSAKGKSPQTVTTYASALHKFEQFLATAAFPPAQTNIETLPGHILEDFYLWLVDQFGRQARSTIRTYLAGVRAMLRYVDRRYALSPAGAGFERVAGSLTEMMGRASYKTPRIDRQGLPAVLRMALEAPTPPDDGTFQGRQKHLEMLRDKAILLTLYSTGMRRAEVSSLNRRDVSDGLEQMAIITGKGSKERNVFFDGPTLAAIRLYLKERADNFQPVFIRHDRGRGEVKAGGSNYRLSPAFIWEVVKRYAAQAGVQVTTHDFRHQKASSLLNNGAKLSEVQDILGHSSPATTKMIYAHYEHQHLLDAFHRYSTPLDEFIGNKNKLPD
jgi:site-specific recombinase XerD